MQTTCTCVYIRVYTEIVHEIAEDGPRYSITIQSLRLFYLCRHNGRVGEPALYVVCSRCSPSVTVRASHQFERSIAGNAMINNDDGVGPSHCAPAGPSFSARDREMQ